MPGIDEKNDSEEEEMERDTIDSEKSEEDESMSGSGSEEDETSDLDEEECERRRTECLDDMADLERQFSDLREQLYYERMTQLDMKLMEVGDGRAEEYLVPLEELQDNMRIRTQVAGILKELKIASIKNKFEAEDTAAHQNYISEKILLYDQVKGDLEEKIRRLEEDRHNIDISSDLWNESQASLKKKKKSDPNSMDSRKKPVTVTGPYLVYMLKDVDIIEDWTAIKKALKQQSQKRKLEHSKRSVVKKPARTEKYPYNARYEDGKLFYEGSWYGKGHHIIIDNKEDSPVHATVTAINTGEVWVKRPDGNKSKLYIAQLQKGKYTIRHVPY